ncbi:MAG: hypothetical protein AAFX99_18875 [Myxococcota bacterium]
MATVPYTEDDDPVQTGGCGEFELCMNSCAQEDDACLTQCFLAGGQGCATCNLSAFRSCGEQLCPSELNTVLGCLATCDDGALACLAGECASQQSVLYDCSAEPITTGACNEAFAACGVEF